MKQVNGWWCPDYDDDLSKSIGEPEFAGRQTYQFYAFQKLFPYVKNFRHALDIGAHVGLWSYPLAACFNNVTAFEPVPDHGECFHRNLEKEIAGGRVVLHAMALGEVCGTVTMVMKPPVSLKARVKSVEGDELPTVSAPMITLDDVHMLRPVDLIKIDCEGYELYVIRGGESVIREHRPLMFIEQKPLNVARYKLGLDAVELLKSWGAEVLFDIGGDYCLGWK